MCVHAQSFQVCLTLCNPMNWSMPISSVHAILQQEYWNELPCSLSEVIPSPGIESTFPVSPSL